MEPIIDVRLLVGNGGVERGEETVVGTSVKGLFGLKEIVVLLRVRVVCDVVEGKKISKFDHQFFVRGQSITRFTRRLPNSSSDIRHG